MSTRGPIHEEVYERSRHARLIRSALTDIADALGDVDGFAGRYSDEERANGQIGGAGWWARALSFAVILGLLLGIVGPFGSYLNGDVLTRIADWAGMTLVGTVIAGLGVPLGVRMGIRFGLPRAFALAVALILAAVPISIVSAFVARSIWPWQTAALRPVDWYAQTLLVELSVVVLWLLVESARSHWSIHAPVATVRAAALPSEPLSADPVLCLQMEDHYVRVHRACGSTLELMTLADAIVRFGDPEGLQVHRSWWVAVEAVLGGERDARNWRLRLTNDLLVPVARNRIPDVRAQGWIGLAGRTQTRTLNAPPAPSDSRRSLMCPHGHFRQPLTLSEWRQAGRFCRSLVAPRTAAPAGIFLSIRPRLDFRNATRTEASAASISAARSD